MSTENLLVRISETVGSRQAENVASAALTYLLQRDVQVREAFVSTVGQRAGRVLPALAFRGQAAASGLGFTDISGVADGAEVLIVEAKILAGLGEGQAATYLRRLHGAGILVVLVPESRLGVVFADAVRQCGARLDAPLRARSAGTVILGLSWEQVLAAIEGATNDIQTRAELEQVVGLYRRLESAAFLPFSGDDLSLRAARLWASLDGIVVRVKTSMARGQPGDDVVFPPRFPVRGGEKFFGVWLTIAGFNAWFGRHTTHWTTLDESPFWLQINNLDQAKSDQVLDALRNDGNVRAYRKPGETDIFVSLRPPVAVDSEAVVAAIVAELRTVAGCLTGRELTGPYAAGSPEPADMEAEPDG